jgi:hypothetical protein
MSFGVDKRRRREGHSPFAPVGVSCCAIAWRCELERIWRTACKARARASPGEVCEGVEEKGRRFPKPTEKWDSRVWEAFALRRSSTNERAAQEYGEPARERGGHCSQATRAARVYQLQTKEAVGTRCSYCLGPALPPAPARAIAGHARARRAQPGCNVRVPRGAHHACLRAARSRALARASARAKWNARRKMRTGARCASARPASLYFDFPTPARASPPPCFFRFFQSPRPPFVESASAILCRAPRLSPTSSPCARSTNIPPPVPVPAPPPCKPSPAPAVLSVCPSLSFAASRCRDVLLARASAALWAWARGTHDQIFSTNSDGSALHGNA